MDVVCPPVRRDNFTLKTGGVDPVCRGKRQCTDRLCRASGRGIGFGYASSSLHAVPSHAFIGLPSGPRYSLVMSTPNAVRIVARKSGTGTGWSMFGEPLASVFP